MIPTRSVLAASAFSPQALGAGARAALLAAEHGAELKLVHVLEQEGLTSLRDWFAPGRDLRAAITEQAQMQLAAAARQLRDQRGVQAQTLVQLGQPLGHINAAAADADLLVLGDHGSHAWRDLEEVERYRSLERQHATEQFRLMLADIEGSGRVETCVEQGDVRIEFLRATKEYQPDMVAIGKQGQGFVADLLLGSVTRIVLAQAQCDVLVVPKGTQDPAG